MLVGGLSHAGDALRGLWGFSTNIHTSKQTHPAARTHLVVVEKGQSGSTKKQQNAATQRELIYLDNVTNTNLGSELKRQNKNKAFC